MGTLLLGTVGPEVCAHGSTPWCVLVEPEPKPRKVAPRSLHDWSSDEITLVLP